MTVVWSGNLTMIVTCSIISRLLLPFSRSMWTIAPIYRIDSVKQTNKKQRKICSFVINAIFIYKWKLFLLYYLVIESMGSRLGRIENYLELQQQQYYLCNSSSKRKLCILPPIMLLQMKWYLLESVSSIGWQIFSISDHHY